MMSTFPTLKIRPRERALHEVGAENIPQVLYAYLWQGLAYREIDRDVLHWPTETRGWESMGLLHHFGFHNAHKGRYDGWSVTAAIDELSREVPALAEYLPALRDICTGRTPFPG